MSSSAGNDTKSEDWMVPPSEPEPVLLPPSYEEATGEEVTQLIETEDIIQIRENEAGLISRPGAGGGKFYCRGSDVVCSCCRGCGPTNGCNCAPCQKLDIKAKQLPRHFYVNKEGAACRRFEETGLMHCGRYHSGFSGIGYWVCGKDDGDNWEQCDPCKVIEDQVENAYAGVWSQHQVESVDSVQEDVDDVIATRKNEAGQSCRPGRSGKFYCGEDLGSAQCSCCRGCGPTNGCNCAPCQKLDIKARKLPRNFYVNREGAACRRSRDTGLIYCGRKVANSGDGHCGPNDGPQC